MTFTTLLSIIQFLLVLLLFIYSLNNKVLKELSYPIRYLLLIISLVPIWGTVLFVMGIYSISQDIRRAKFKKEKILKNTFFNRFLFGKDICS